MVVNCGGGIVELTLGRLMDDNKLVEKSPSSSKLCGSIYIDEEFLAFMSKKVGSDALKNLEANDHEQLQYMVQKFCKRIKLLFTGKMDVYDIDLAKFVQILNNMLLILI